MASVQFNITGTGAAKAAKDFDDIRKAIEATLKAAQAFNNATNKPARVSAIQKEINAINKLKDAYVRAELSGRASQTNQAKRLAEITRRTEALAAATSRVTNLSGMAKYRAELAKLQKQYEELALAGKAGGVDGRNLLDQIRARAAQIREVQTALNNANPPAARPSASSGIYSQFLNVAKFQVLSGVVNLLGAAISNSLETVIAFDAAVANLESIAVVGKSAETAALELEALKENALLLGKTTVFTATEVVNLQTELIKLGFTSSEVVKLTSPIVDFSVAVGKSAEDVAHLTGVVIKSFGLSVLDTRRVVDVLAQATIDSALSFDYLATAIPTVAAAASVAGLSLEETAAVLAVLADRGVQANTAATSFRNILIESAGRGLQYRDALELITKSADKLTTAYELFGKRGAVQAIILAANIAEVNTQTERLEDRLIKVKDVADIQLQSIENKTKLLVSAWDGLVLAVSNTSVWKRSLDLITTFLNGLGVVIDRFQGKNKIDGFVDVVKIQKEQDYIDSYYDFVTFGTISQGKAAATYNLLLQTQIDLLDEQARKKEGIFGIEISQLDVLTAMSKGTIKLAEESGKYSKRRIASMKILNGYIEEQNALLVKTAEKEGLVSGTARANLVKDNIKGILALLGVVRDESKAAALAAETAELSLKDLLKVDVNQLGTLSALEKYINDLKEGQQNLNFKTDLATFNKTSERINKAEAIRNDLMGKQVNKAKDLKQILSDLQDKLSKAKTDEQRFSILEDIKVVNAKIKDQEDAYEKFLLKLQGLGLKYASKKEQEAFLKFTKEKLDLEEKIALESLAATEKNETIRGLKEQEIKEKFIQKNLEAQRSTLLETSTEYESVLSDLRTSYAKGVTLKINIATEELKRDLGIEETTILARVENLITNEKDRQTFSDATRLEYKKKELEIALQTLLIEEKKLGVINLLLGTNAQLTEEQKANITKIKTEISQITRQLSEIDPTLGAGAFEAKEAIDYYAKISKAYNDYRENIEKDPIDFASANDGKSAKELLEKQLRDLTLIRDINQKKEELRQVNAQISEINAKKIQYDLIITQEKEFQAKLAALRAAGKFQEADDAEKERPPTPTTPTAAAGEDIIAKQAKLQAELNKLQADGSKERDEKAEEEFQKRLKTAERQSRAIAKFAEKAGEAFGEALVNGEGTKEAFKELMKDLIDIIVQAELAALAIKLGTALAALPFSIAQVVGLTAAIAGVAGLGAVGKAAIDRFEEGGEIKSKASAGGTVVGPSHKQGGVKFRVRGTNYIPELEGGETVINKRSSEMFRQELSAINSYKGYGKRFADGGLIENAPQVLKPQGDSVSLSYESIVLQAELIASKVSNSQLEVLVAQNDQLIKGLQIALDRTNRLEERLTAAQKQSTL